MGEEQVGTLPSHVVGAVTRGRVLPLHQDGQEILGGGEQSEDTLGKAIL